MDQRLTLGWLLCARRMPHTDQHRGLGIVHVFESRTSKIEGRSVVGKRLVNAVEGYYISFRKGEITAVGREYQYALQMHPTLLGRTVGVSRSQRQLTTTFASRDGPNPMLPHGQKLNVISQKQLRKIWETWVSCQFTLHLCMLL